LHLAPKDEQPDDLGASQVVADIRRMEAAMRSAPRPKTGKPAAPPAPFAPGAPSRGISTKQILIGLAVVGAAWWAWKKYGRRALRRNPDELDEFYRETHWGVSPRRRRRTAISELPRKLVEMGALEAVIYTTRKGGRKLADYIHHFGEDGGKRPSLAVDPKNKRLHIVGGSYDVRPEGIVG
jgi:hypothetical protein